ncbi:MAG: ABC transporter substrate-binding protein [Thermostichus sp. HHBFW_bins_43]
MSFSRRRSFQAFFLTLAGCLTLGVLPGSLMAQSSDLLAQVKERGVLRVSTDANYRPQSYLNPDGTWEGFDVDVAREIASRLGVEAEFLDINFDVITAGSWNGRWDVNVGSMTVTAERQQALLFTIPYYYTPASFVVHETSTIADIPSLEGKRVGVGTATTYQAYLEGTLTLEGETIEVPAPRVDIRIYDTDSLALQDLALGDGVRLDAVLTALPTAENAIQEGLPLKTLGDPVYYEALAVALDRSSPANSESLQAEISTILEAMHADGTLTALSERYYGIDLTQKVR